MFTRDANTTAFTANQVFKDKANDNSTTAKCLTKKAILNATLLNLTYTLKE